MNEYTVKNIAEMLQTDKQKVYRAITRLQVSPCKQDGNRYYYDDNTVDLVRNALENRITTSKTMYQKSESIHFNEAKVYEDYIKTLKEQIETKDKQIQELQETIKAFTVLQIQQEKPRLLDRIFKRTKESA